MCLHQSNQIKCINDLADTTYNEGVIVHHHLITCCCCFIVEIKRATLSTSRENWPSGLCYQRRSGSVRASVQSDQVLTYCHLFVNKLAFEIKRTATSRECWRIGYWYQWTRSASAFVQSDQDHQWSTSST